MMLPITVESETIVRFGAQLVSPSSARYACRMTVACTTCRPGSVRSPCCAWKTTPIGCLQPGTSTVGFSSRYTSARPCGWDGRGRTGNPMP